VCYYLALRGHLNFNNFGLTNSFRAKFLAFEIVHPGDGLYATVRYLVLIWLFYVLCALDILSFSDVK